jgi:hypothetical protein
MAKRRSSAISRVADVKEFTLGTAAEIGCLYTSRDGLDGLDNNKNNKGRSQWRDKTAAALKASAATIRHPRPIDGVSAQM